MYSSTHIRLRQVSKCHMMFAAWLDCILSRGCCWPNFSVSPFHPSLPSSPPLPPPTRPKGEMFRLVSTVCMTSCSQDQWYLETSGKHKAAALKTKAKGSRVHHAYSNHLPASNNTSVDPPHVLNLDCLYNETILKSLSHTHIDLPHDNWTEAPSPTIHSLNDKWHPRGHITDNSQMFPFHRSS